jgi:hypothetical protein
MAITTYTELQTAVGNWLGRSDLTSRLPEFIAMAEPKIRRKLRDKKVIGALTLSVGVASKALGSTVKELESMRFNHGDKQYALREMTPEGLASLRRTGTGTPMAYAVVGDTAYFNVAPDAAYVLEITYIEKIAALSGGAPTNTVLTNSPDIYMYGTLIEAEPYLEHDERVGMWKGMFEEAIMEENIYRERQEIGANPEAQLPVVFGEDDGL